MDVGCFCSTRASATAVNVTGAGAPLAGRGSATVTAPAATTTAAMKERAHGARMEKLDKRAPSTRATVLWAPGPAATVLRIVDWFDHPQ